MCTDCCILNNNYNIRCTSKSTLCLSISQIKLSHIQVISEIKLSIIFLHKVFDMLFISSIDKKLTNNNYNVALHAQQKVEELKFCCACINLTRTR